MTTRKELVEALRLRYRGVGLGERAKILDEFVALAGYHRKHAIRVLRGRLSPLAEVQPRNRVYDEAVVQALTILLEAGDRVCGKRLKPLIPMLVDAMQRHGGLPRRPDHLSQPASANSGAVHQSAIWSSPMRPTLEQVASGCAR
ncbi:MAG: hypothetical protein ACO33A_09900 [Hyphomonas sp.]